jgi:hypothetical protein
MRLSLFILGILISSALRALVIRGYAKDKNLNLILIGTIPFPHSKDKRSPVDKRYLVRQGATTFKKETIR